jgi:hypothetical protein
MVAPGVESERVNNCGALYVPAPGLNVGGGTPDVNNPNAPTPVVVAT